MLQDEPRAARECVQPRSILLLYCTHMGSCCWKLACDCSSTVARLAAPISSLTATLVAPISRGDLLAIAVGLCLRRSILVRSAGCSCTSLRSTLYT